MAISSPAVDLAKHMDAEEFLDANLDLFVGEWSPDFGKQVLIMDGVGIAPELQDCYEAPNIQILVRGSHDQGYQTVYEFAKSVSDYVINLSKPQELNGVCYQSFAVDTPMQHLGKDDRNRHNFTMSFRTYRNFN